MLYVRVILCLVALASSFVLPAWAQDTSCLHRTLPLIATDGEGRPIKGLTASDFHAEFRGQPIRILSASPEERPHRIVIILDASGSMQEHSREWDVARTLASHVAESHLPNTTYALLIFADKINEEIDFSQGTNAVANRLLQIGADPSYSKNHVRGHTALRDTILAGLRLLNAPTSADVIYVISDGGDNRSRSSPNDVKRALVSSGVRLFVSIFVSGIGMPEEMSGAGELADVVRATGGSFFGRRSRLIPFGHTNFELDTKERLALGPALNRLYQWMVEDYLIAVELPQPVDKWREWTLRIAKEKQRQFKDIHLAYPHQLMPCIAGAAN